MRLFSTWGEMMSEHCEKFSNGVTDSYFSRWPAGVALTPHGHQQLQSTPQKSGRD